MSSARDVLSRHLGGDRLAGAIPQTHARVEVIAIPVGAIERDESQPRQTFDDDELRDLAGSLRQHGQLQPIRVVRAGPGLYRVVAGERRWRAAQIAGIETLQAIVLDERVDREAIAAQQIVENLQRAAVDPVELARFYRRCLDDWNCSQAELARRLSTSAASVCRTLALLDPPQDKPAARPRRRRAAPTDKRRGVVVETRAAGTVRVKRGYTLEHLVEELRGMIDEQERGTAAAA